MPIDSILVSIAVVSVFAIFSVVLLWGDSHTRPMSHQAASRPGRRRAF
jgi:hypothetical protein